MSTDTGTSDLVHPERCRAFVRRSSVDRLGNRLTRSKGERSGIYKTASSHSGSSSVTKSLRIGDGSHISTEALRSHEEQRSALSLRHKHGLSTGKSCTVYCVSDILNIDSKRHWTNQRDTGHAVVTNIRSEDCDRIRPTSPGVERSNGRTRWRNGLRRTRRNAKGRSSKPRRNYCAEHNIVNAVETRKTVLSSRSNRRSRADCSFRRGEGASRAGCYRDPSGLRRIIEQCSGLYSCWVRSTCPSRERDTNSARNTSPCTASLVVYRNPANSSRSDHVVYRGEEQTSRGRRRTLSQSACSRKMKRVNSISGSTHWTRYKNSRQTLNDNSERRNKD